MPERIVVVGMPPVVPVPEADLYVGARRHLDGRTPAVELGPVGAALDTIARTPGTVCVLASGDPGFFGIVRVLAERFGPESLEVHPAPSSVALAFARLGLPWDDALVVSAHARPLAAAAQAVADAPKAAVLVAPDSPPEALGKELLALGGDERHVAVCSRLGEADELVTRTDLPGLAAGTWDARSVVVLWRGSGVAPAATLEWGRPDTAFAHRAGMITKGEVRAVVLSKLALPDAGVLWDVGAGSGSVAIEAARLSRGLRVVALEQRADDCERIRANAAQWDASVDVIEGRAPEALAQLPDPDRVFVGGGGLDVLDAALDRLRPGGVVVATYAVLARAVSAHERLRNLVQVSVARAEPVAAAGIRLAAENPVFVAWGPR